MIGADIIQQIVKLIIGHHGVGGKSHQDPGAQISLRFN